MGTSGKHAKNCERDFHTMLKTFSKRFGATIEVVKARMYNHETSQVEWQDIACLFPDTMAAALFQQGPRVWNHTMFGNRPPQEVLQYWEHCKQHCDWFRGSTCYDYPNLSKLIGMSFYGDDIAAYKASETGSITCLGWSSDLSYKNSSMTRYFPICVYPDYSATEWTHDDIMSHVIARVRDMVDPEVIHIWSEDGSQFVFSSLQGDLKFVRDQYHLHDYRSNEFCSLCGAVKSHMDVSMTLADFRENASHTSSLPDLTLFNHNRNLAII